MRVGWRQQRDLARALALAASVMGAGACSRAQPLASDVRHQVTWQEDVAAPFAEQCTSCHAGPQAGAGYETTTYLKAIGYGRAGKAPVAVAGNSANSPLVAKLASGGATHTAVGAIVLGDGRTVLQLVTAWVDGGQLGLFRGTVHDAGILNPADAAFHGKALRASKYDMNACAKCHGADFTGGAAGVSCKECHTAAGGPLGGPTGCTTCHGAPPANGAHVAHAAKGLDCSECHKKPAAYDAPGHLLDASGNVKSAAVVTFGAFAAKATPKRAGAPAYAAATCSNVYCHGGGTPDAKATNQKPSWTGGAAQVACGTCHGLPPADHTTTAGRECRDCHRAVAGPGLTIANAALHGDGLVQIGDGAANACNSCHGSATSAAPPGDLRGNTSPSAVGVGAHQAHLKATQLLSDPVACSACHVVPTAMNSPGHVDPAGALVAFSGLAVADGAKPAWVDATASCSATYCHGGGDKISKRDKTPGLRPNLSWTSTSPMTCNSCHGAPPTGDGIHLPTMALSDCHRCHAATVNEGGGILFTGPVGAKTTKHMNGVLDVVSAY